MKTLIYLLLTLIMLSCTSRSKKQIQEARPVATDGIITKKICNTQCNCLVLFSDNDDAGRRMNTSRSQLFWIRCNDSIKIGTRYKISPL